jgi:hypothetical protein
VKKTLSIITALVGFTLFTGIAQALDVILVKGTDTMQFVMVTGTPFQNYIYTKDNRANPPICTVVVITNIANLSGAGGGPAVVPCFSLKPYFDSKRDFKKPITDLK